MLCHEAWSTSDAPANEATHTSARDAGTIADEAGVDALTLIHVRPGIDEDALLDDARAAFAATAIGADLVRLEWPDSGH